MEVIPAAFTALNAYSVHKITNPTDFTPTKERKNNSEGAESEANCITCELKVLRKPWEWTKILVLTDLKETSFRREDRNMSIIAATASSTHYFKFWNSSEICSWFFPIQSNDVWCYWSIWTVKEVEALFPRHFREEERWNCYFNPKLRSKYKKWPNILACLTFTLYYLWAALLLSHHKPLLSVEEKKIIWWIDVSDINEEEEWGVV